MAHFYDETAFERVFSQLVRNLLYEYYILQEALL